MTATLFSNFRQKHSSLPFINTKRIQSCVQEISCCLVCVTKSYCWIVHMNFDWTLMSWKTLSVDYIRHLYLLVNTDVTRWLWALGNFHMKVLFLLLLEISPNTLISLGHHTDSLSDEEMVGRIWIDTYYLDVWFKHWMNLKRMNSLFDINVYTF